MKKDKVIAFCTWCGRRGLVPKGQEKDVICKVCELKSWLAGEIDEKSGRK